MSTPVPSSKFATLSGSALSFSPGTITADALIGSATLTARRDSIALSSASPVPAIVALPVIVCQFVAGVFSGVKLLGGNIPESNFGGWTWHIEFDLKTAQGITVEMEGFDFVALAGESMDIASLSRVKPSAGTLKTPVLIPGTPDPEPVPDVIASYQDPYSSDGDGTSQDYVYIYESAEVDWLLNDSPVLPGVHYVTGEATVKAVPLSGFVLAQGAGTYPFSLSAATATRVISEEPFWGHSTGDAYIPVVTGLVYTDEYGNVLTQGTMFTGLSGLTTIYVNADEGFINDGAPYFQHDFSALVSDVPSASRDDSARTFTLDAANGVEYKHGQFDVLPAGTYALSDWEPSGDYILIRAFALAGWVLPSGANYDELPLYFTAV